MINANPQLRQYVNVPGYGMMWIPVEDRIARYKAQQVQRNKDRAVQANYNGVRKYQ